jgi:hypothetical protein
MERDRVIGGIANSQSPNQKITKSRNASLLDPTPAAEPAVNPSPAAAAGVPAFVPERGVLEAGEGRDRAMEEGVSSFKPTELPIRRRE